mgnify:CR=1 FL=1
MDRNRKGHRPGRDRPAPACDSNDRRGRAAGNTGSRGGAGGRIPVRRYRNQRRGRLYLACLAYHEARGEPFEGQVAVIEVVLNRCLSDYFPDTVEEVVFQKYGDVWQFSPAPYLYTAEPTETQYEAVYAALAAEEPILPLDTVYFSTGPYNDSIVAVIGNHYFCSIF